MEDFKWTDELVAEYSLTNQKMTLYEFKRFVQEREQSKQQSNKDWEIVEKRRKAHEGSYGIIGDGDWYIYSVRRLSDNEVFTVGDKQGNLTITHFKIKDGNMYAHFAPSAERDIEINQLQKQKQKLFTTTDGKDIFEGDEYWFITSGLIGVPLPNTASSTNGAGKATSSYKYFSTEEKAKEYIIYNKPLFSISDVMLECEKGSFHNRPHDRFDEDYWAIYNSVLKEKLQQLAQQKINNTK